MTSIEERLQIKREPLDKWSIREQLCLAVARNMDQNLTSVSRALKPFGEPNRPPDWFHQKNCAAQYGALLANVETPKRQKKKAGSNETVMETPAEAVLRKLLGERKAELQKLLAEEKAEYLKLQEDMVLLQSGTVSEDQLDIWCKEIDEEEQKKEQESQAHSQWLREREQRKQEIERAWRPVKPPPLPGQKRKMSETVEELEEEKPETPKPPVSPLLTSLLKSPSQVPPTSTILHTTITNQKPANSTTPTIASLLNSKTNVSVSPSLQQLVSSAIGQEPITEGDNIQTNDILDDANLLKIDDLASSILIPSGESLPEMKNVDVIISDLIENADDIVADPEQHLQLDGNGDINLNLELEDFEENEAEVEPEQKEVEIEVVEPPQEKIEKIVDPFEFQEDEFEVKNEEKPPEVDEVIEEEIEIKEEELKDVVEEKKVVPGSVEIVEVVELDDEEIDKELNKSQIEDIVHCVKPEKEEIEKEPEVAPVFEDLESKEPKEPEVEAKQEEELPQTSGNVSDFNEELYDDLAMEVKVDKSGKAKRDYSRKKKDEKEFDMLLAIEKANTDIELTEEALSDKDCEKETKDKVKPETERSSSPWTEEEDVSSVRNKRRVSTPATPTDSVPNSPVSSIYFYDDDREYRNWKKSVMLVYSRLAANKYASLFSKPITDEQAPGYHSLVYRPMDLLTIRKNIENGTIKTTQEFQRDVLLMLNNAIMYNKTNGTVYDMARQMQQESLQQLQILLQAQMQADTPARRETRTSEPGLKRKRTTEEVSRSAKKRKDD